ncbi:MAG: hypothetical protein A2201_12145 [Alicyclobacillus sp. RIFOXYA1_FULL_53_8]|nr:MAG: hypothetical protein A2201_12145 [Alicyclobacillus sp. RIFOXYA1_FULL_53_8]
MLVCVALTVLTVTGCAGNPPTNSLAAPQKISSNSISTTSPTGGQTASRNSVLNPGTINPQPKWIPIPNVVLARSPVPGQSGEQLELVDVKGNFAKNPIVGPFQGNNWTGQFQLWLVDPLGRIVSKLSLPPNQYTLFMRNFQFHFADYNGDGHPDFTIGQRADSNGYWYQLFTIKSNELSRLPTPSSELFVSDFTYSPLLQRVQPNGFALKYYANSQAKWFKATYSWEGTKFIQSDVQAIPPSG